MVNACRLGKLRVFAYLLHLYELGKLITTLRPHLSFPIHSSISTCTRNPFVIMVSYTALNSALLSSFTNAPENASM